MNIMMFIGCILGGIIGIMVSFYIVLCFVSWMQDVFDKTTWRWKK